MVKIEIKSICNTIQCVCDSHNVKHRIILTGTHGPKEIPLCDDCLNALKEKFETEES